VVVGEGVRIDAIVRLSDVDVDGWMEREGI